MRRFPSPSRSSIGAFNHSLIDVAERIELLHRASRISKIPEQRYRVRLLSL
jgi:hypothetical protein